MSWAKQGARIVPRVGGEHDRRICREGRAEERAPRARASMAEGGGFLLLCPGKGERREEELGEVGEAVREENEGQGRAGRCSGFINQERMVLVVKDLLGQGQG
jgi:hypothetical protein